MSARAILALSAACVLLASAAAPVPAMGAPEQQQQSPLQDQGSSPNYRSTITSISPSTRGLGLQVLQFSDRLLLRNQTGRTVSIEGYEGEPYARIRPDGTVEVNKRAPAYYLNQSFYGNVTVPASASPTAAPQWSVVDRTGQFEWHDHRIHWMSPALPPQVKDKGERTLIFDWHVPIVVGAQKGSVAGQLFWTPNSSSAPVAAIVVGAAIVVLGLLFVLGVRRRRSPRHAAVGVGAGGFGGEARGGAGATPSVSRPGPAGAGEGAGEKASEEASGHREAW
ncbi:MAG TPA: hypothetical protein VHW67_10295 [Solirubrobacteraceae bacterium]|nr:hypothetical protein [Solirubrobacteraceae bacterium]